MKFETKPILTAVKKFTFSEHDLFHKSSNDGLSDCPGGRTNFRIPGTCGFWVHELTAGAFSGPVAAGMVSYVYTLPNGIGGRAAV